jgi:hypothetical protein
MAIEVVCDVCQSRYNLKDEFAGKKLKCKQCQSVLVVPEVEYDLSPEQFERVERGYHPSFDRDTFFLNQKAFTLNEKYRVFDENKQPILFIERPIRMWRSALAILAAVGTFLLGLLVTGLLVGMLATVDKSGVAPVVAALVVGIASLLLAVIVAIRISPKRHIYIYSDEEKTDKLLEVLQDQKVALINATYTVQTPEGERLGSFRKNYLYNFFRKRWFIYGPEGQDLGLAKEDSMILSLLRRFLGPFFGLLRTNFIILPPDSEQVIGEFNRKFSLFDRYVLDLTRDPNHSLDRRMAVSLAVLLDTGERR